MSFVGLPLTLNVGTITGLVDAATIAWDTSRGFAYSVTIAGSRTLGIPTGPVINGAVFTLAVTQGGSGSQVLHFAAGGYKFASASPPVLSTAAGAVDILTFYSSGGVLIFLSLVKRVAAQPPAPSNFAAIGVGTDAHLSWTDNSSGTETFRVEIFDVGDWTGAGSETELGVTTFEDVERGAGTYTYRVIGVRDGFTSDASNTAQATVT